MSRLRRRKGWKSWREVVGGGFKALTSPKKGEFDEPKEGELLELELGVGVRKREDDKTMQGKLKTQDNQHTLRCSTQEQGQAHCRDKASHIQEAGNAQARKVQGNAKQTDGTK